MTEENTHEEKMELGHEPIPIYVKIFHISIIIGVLYLGIIFWRRYTRIPGSGDLSVQKLNRNQAGGRPSAFLQE